MRILVVSNLYPPHVIGGYELGCRDIVEALKQRGHELLVLTSTYGIQGKSSDPEVKRELTLENSENGDNPRLYIREFANRRTFRRVLRSFRPDLIYFWNQTWLPGFLVKIAARANIPYVFYLSDDGLLRWRTDSLWQWWTFRHANLFKNAFKTLGRKVLSALSVIDGKAKSYYHHRQFTSEYIQKLVATTEDPRFDRVIPWGIDIQRFPFRADTASRPTRLLYVGQIVPHKGVRTAVEAMHILRNRFQIDDAVLTVIGGTTTPEFVTKLEQLIATKDLAGCVRLLGKVDRARLAAIYQEHDILIFPSEWEEPFAITPLEAMASGLAVVGTTTGGSKEIFRDGENALVFRPQDAEGCARAISALMDDPATYRRLRDEGRRLVEERYSIDKMVDAIERHLLETAAPSQRDAGQLMPA